MREGTRNRLAFAVLVCLGFLQTADAGPVRPISGGDRANLAGGGGSFTPAITPNGRLVVFVSHANNLVTNDDHAPFLDVFLRDVAAKTTALLSVNRTGFGGGDGDSSAPSISSNGQFIAFASTASNLVTNDTNHASDIFVRDAVSGITRLVSVDTTGAGSARSFSAWNDHRLSNNPLISADGRWVIFESLATNLTSFEDTNQTTDIFARDLQSNVTFLVSINATGDRSGDGRSESPAVSSDGRSVAFVSSSTNLVAGATNRFGEIYVRDLQANTTFWASRNVASLYGKDYRCFNPVITPDGRFVAFKATTSLSMGLDPVRVFRYDVRLGTTVMVTNYISFASVVTWPQMSVDGRFILSENSGYLEELLRADLVSNSVSWVCSASYPASCSTPVMTPDGSRVVFVSSASNLSPNATNGILQIFVRDIAAQTTRLVSVTTNGSASSRDIDVTIPAVSADGRLVVFESEADDLVPNDLNRASDIFLRDLDAGTTELISVRDPLLPARTSAAGSKAFPKSISADGRYVAFGGPDGYLVPNDTNAFQDVFVRDLLTGTFFPVAFQWWVPCAGCGGPGTRADPPYPLRYPYTYPGVEAVLNTDGRYCVHVVRPACFTGSCGVGGISRFDSQFLTNEFVTLGFDGNPTGADCSNPAISSDGNVIAFQSSGTSLTALPIGSFTNVFVRDMHSRTSQLVSVNLPGTAGGNGPSVAPLFSPDDRWIVFSSVASDLTTNSTGGLTSLYARDNLSNSTRMISVGDDGRTAMGYARGAVFSANSRYLAFVTASNLVLVYDFESSTSRWICAACDNPSISADGRFVAHEISGSSTSLTDIVVKDLQNGVTNLVSINRQMTGGGNASSSTPLLSWDGRYVVFSSTASDLVDNDTNQTSDIFVRDRVLGTTLLVSLSVDGNRSGNGPSFNPVLAADGRTVLFQSFASDLIAGDYNDARDVFVLHLEGPDTDGDGIDDGWEMAYFGTLARDGSGDFDGDGQTDLQEYIAGTDPTGNNSTLRVLTLTLMGGGGTKLIWSATPGKSYQVQFKDCLGDPAGWTNLPGVAVANGTTMSMVDTTAATGDHRFYRVMVTH